MSTAPAAAAELPNGVLLDDCLADDARRELDLAANRALSRWRDRWDELLTIDGVCLPHVYEGELMADVFMREHRIAAGLRSAFAENPPAGAELHGVDSDLAVFLEQLLAELGVACTAVSAGAPPSYPIAFRRSVMRRGRVLGAAREALGVPARVRGSVLVRPFWHLTPLWQRLLETPGANPVLDPVAFPSLPRWKLAAVATRGGWIGHPGQRGRRRARAAVAKVLAGPADSSDEPGTLDWLLERRARTFLEQRARDTLVPLSSLRAAFASGRVRNVVVPSDGAPEARAMATAARETGVRVIQVQHGFFGDLWRVEGRPAPYVDGLVADRVAVWSQRDRRRLTRFSTGEVRCTGNPGTLEIARGTWPRERAASPRSVLVLVQPPATTTPLFDARAPWRYIHEVLRALATVRMDLGVVIRPHPLDTGDYRHSHGCSTSHRLVVDRESPIEALLADARLCIAPLSTATLQAAASGIRTVFFDVSGVTLPWPFDGSGDLPRAGGADQLAELIPRVLATSRPPGRDAAAEALGVSGDALERVVELILEP